jgi:guanosine-3',5'-bis(diphosphate) 3'-pyrophosphohydrolase
MSTTPIPLAELPFEAAAFAARAHQHQKRKDGQTPYVSHVFRVCLVARHVFGFDDPRMLAAALLHDTIEDTATDCDDISERFGPEVAKWVAALTKDMRLPDKEREEMYAKTLAGADWQVTRNTFHPADAARPPRKRGSTSMRSAPVCRTTFNRRCASWKSGWRNWKPV